MRHKREASIAQEQQMSLQNDLNNVIFRPELHKTTRKLVRERPRRCFATSCTSVKATS